MTESKNVNESFDKLAKILLRCFVLGYFLVLVWFVIYLTLGDMNNRIGKLFDLTPHEVGVINYCGLAMMKGANLLFFLCPYIAIRWVLRKPS
ncbi:MAG TPA: hypothetical protein VG097_07780 [Gemmata sp.]|nr:hypothetical protein [Gemmata sp.]